MLDYYIRIVEKTYFRGYLNLACNNCKVENETELSISCKTLVYKFLINLWSWGKEASTYCNKCYYSQNIIINEHTNKEIINEYNDAKIPLKYKAGGIIAIIFISLLLLSILIRYGTIASNKIVSFFETPQEKITGKWISNSEDVVFIFEDKTYTAIIDDSLFTGKYKFNTNESKAFLFDKSSYNEVPIENRGEIGLSFENRFLNYFKDDKITIASTDNPYNLKFQKWRIKSNVSESKQQIKKRVLEYLFFCKRKYDWALEEDVEFIENDKISPIAFTSSGIWFSDESLEEWKSIFNSNENWTLANQILIDNLPKEFEFKEEVSSFKNLSDILQLYINNVEKYKL